MRIAFMGSPDFAVPALRALHQAGHAIAAVYCQPARPAGRGQAVRRCPVHVAADELGLTVRTPARLRTDPAAQAAFAALDLDAAVVAAYGLILPQAMLDAPAPGCLNIHASLLPRWRGAAPIQAAILAGDTETGITIMQMEAGLDTGPMLLRQSVPITAKTTAASPARHPGRARRDADPGRPRHRPHRPSRKSTPTPPTPRSSPARTAASTGPSPPPRSTAGSAPSIRGPARSPRSPAAR